MELVGYEDIETRSHEALASLVVHILLNQDYGAESLVTYLENKEDFDIEYDDYDEPMLIM